jgi:hypothetical protein
MGPEEHTYNNNNNNNNNKVQRILANITTVHHIRVDATYRCFNEKV